MSQNQTDRKQSKFATVKAKAGIATTALAVTVMTSSPAMAALSQPNVAEATTYIEGLTSGAGFEIAIAGLMMTVGIRGLKRIRGAF